MPSSLLDEHFGAYLGCSSTHKEAQALTSRSSKKSQKRKKPSRPSTVKTSSGDDDMGDEERKRAKRRSQNRVSAQISREKKRLYVESLEKRVRALEKKNAQLNKTITMLLNNQNVTAPMTPPEDSEYMTAAGNTSSDYTPSPPPSPPMEPAAVPPPPPVLDPPLELRNLQEISIDEPAVLITQQSAVPTSVFSQMQVLQAVLITLFATALWAMELSSRMLPSPASVLRSYLLPHQMFSALTTTALRSKTSKWTSTSNPPSRRTASIPPASCCLEEQILPPSQSKLNQSGEPSMHERWTRLIPIPAG